MIAPPVPLLEPTERVLMLPPPGVGVVSELLRLADEPRVLLLRDPDELRVLLLVDWSLAPEITLSVPSGRSVSAMCRLLYALNPTGAPSFRRNARMLRARFAPL
jgi:hypothetical protein